MQLQPIEKTQRIHTIDIIRGFSLFGILCVNMLAFYVPMPHVTDLQTWFTDVYDIIAHQYLDIYVQSSFYPLFSMLFGYGITMQFVKAQKANQSFYKFASKRMIVLFALGMLHAYLIWWGDILATYAFCGAFLLLFIRFSIKRLLIIALILNGLFQALFIGSIIAVNSIEEESFQIEMEAIDIMAVDESITAYATGTWLDAFEQRKKDLAIQFAPMMWISSLFTILPYMLIGAAASKARLFERAKEKWLTWTILAIVGLSIGLWLKSAAFTNEGFLYDYLKVYVGGPILAVGYAAVIVLLCLLPVVVKALSPVAKLGRMSLTMYLLQSIILSVVFYHWGFGYYGKISVVEGIYMAIVIYIIQLIIAELWLMKFSQGPIEWFMKKIIYPKKLSEK